MNIKEYEAKTIEEAKEKALTDLGVTEKEILFKTEEKKGKLFKGTTYVYKAITIQEVAEYMKKELDQILKNMSIEAKYEMNIRDEQINLKIYSNKNNILIGKNGQTLLSLQSILRQMVYKEIGTYPYILLDVENYKEKKNIQLERMAIKIAKEVQKTKIKTELENMNSYERRIVHNALLNFKNIKAESEGEEPNRHIVISYQENE